MKTTLISLLALASVAGAEIISREQHAARIVATPQIKSVNQIFNSIPGSVGIVTYSDGTTAAVVPDPAKLSKQARTELDRYVVAVAASAARAKAAPTPTPEYQARVAAQNKLLAEREAEQKAKRDAGFVYLSGKTLGRTKAGWLVIADGRTVHVTGAAGSIVDGDPFSAWVKPDGTFEYTNALGVLATVRNFKP